MGSTGAGGRGALTIVTMIDDRAELEKCEERVGGGGPGQNACTSPYIEGYRGKVGAKLLFCPRYVLRIPPPPLNSGVWLGCVSLSWCDAHPNNTQWIAFLDEPSKYHARIMHIICNTRNILF
jgi:hypothetical protein